MTTRTPARARTRVDSFECASNTPYNTVADYTTGRTRRRDRWAAAQAAHAVTAVNAVNAANVAYVTVRLRPKPLVRMGAVAVAAAASLVT